MLAPPNDTTLPFFAYGVFKPGELAFLQIKEFVGDLPRNCTISGELLIRDGLPIASPEGQGGIRGVLLTFRTDKQTDAYKRIGGLEPEKQYRWGTIETGFGKANYLAGVSPHKGSVRAEEEWTGRNDPLFTVALDVVEETLGANRDFNWDLKPLFRLEMAYLLLWTAIERYASLRYHLREKATQKVLKLAEERAFQAALAQEVHVERKVVSAEDPTDHYVLSANNASKSLKYYHQVRNNLVHRGKGVVMDHDRVRDSLTELLSIFKATLKAAFEESKWQENHG